MAVIYPCHESQLINYLTPLYKIGPGHGAGRLWIYVALIDTLWSKPKRYNGADRFYTCSATSRSRRLADGEVRGRHTGSQFYNDGIVALWATFVEGKVQDFSHFTRPELAPLFKHLPLQESRHKVDKKNPKEKGGAVQGAMESLG